MMFDFPNTPTVGQQFTPAGGPTYQWNGTGWTLLGAPTAGMLNQQVFVNTGTPTNPFTTTYTPTPGMATAIIECVGGGGGGGGITNTASTYGLGAGGGSGGYSRKFVTAAQVGASQVVTIGAGGTGAAAGTNPATAGGDTSVGSLCIAKGARAAASAAAAGLGGLPGTGDVVGAGNNGTGGSSIPTATGYVWIGEGGGSIFGGGGLPPGAGGTGINASNYGAGGGGGYNPGTGTAAAGGNGSPGIVIITEYANVSVGTATGATSHTGGFINKFRNGMMDVAQRGVGPTTLSGAAYTLDGWIASYGGTALQWSQQYNANLSANALRFAGASGNTAIWFYQRIESSIAAQLLANNKGAQPITIQFTIYNNTGGSITPQLQTAYPTARDNFASTSPDLAVNLQTITNGTIATVAYTFTPNVACQLGYQVLVSFPSGLTSGYVDISYADIRATPGIVTGLNNNPPPVEMRPIQQELAFCQRYYFDPSNGAATAPISYSAYSNAAVATVFPSSLPYPVPLRASPTLTSKAVAYANCSALNVSGTAYYLNGQVNVSAVGPYQVSFGITASAEL